MKTTISAMFFITLYYLLEACSPKAVPMNFVGNDIKPIEIILKEAKKENKLIFVDIYTTWCGPCKWMDANVFTDPEVAHKFNKSFINYKVNGESFDGVNIGLKYRVDSYPTYLFLNAKGEVVLRLEGMLPASNLLSEAESAEQKIKKH